MIKKAVNKIDNRILFAVIICTQIVFMLWYCDMKSGYFVDELWSYGLSNSYYHAQIWEDDALEETEIDPESFDDYLVVNPGEEFTYDSVLYNQTHDSHPPLFYIVLHTISSFFPGVFSKWFALIPNLFYYVISILFLYKISGLFTKNKFFAFMPVLLYGFSIAAVNSVTYIRMYMLLTMWCLIFSYVHLKSIYKEKITVGDLVLLSVSVFGGVFTHYFFVIFAFPWVIIYLVWLLKRKDLKGFIKYAVSGIVGFAIASICFPSILMKVLGRDSGHSQGVYSSMSNLQDWIPRIKTYISITSSEMFGSMFTLLLIMLVLSVIFYVITHVLWIVKLKCVDNKYTICIEKNAKEENWVWEIKREHFLAFITGVTTFFYFIIVSKIAPWLSNRYMMPQFPFIVLLFCLSLYWILKVWKVDYNKRIMCLLISIVMIGGLTYYFADPGYLYPEKKDNVAISEKYEDLSCVYIYSTSYIMINNALELENYDKLYQMYYQNMDSAMKKVTIKDNKLVVYIDRLLDEDSQNMTMDGTECLEKAMELTLLDKQKMLFEDDKIIAYLLYK